MLTSDASRCDYYRSESQNVKSRYQCLIPNEDFRKNLNTRRKAIPNNQEECESEEVRLSALHSITSPLETVYVICGISDVLM